MAIPSILNTGRSGMVAAKAAISTTGHNIANANVEGFSRQRVITESAEAGVGRVGGGRATFGAGTQIARVERVNDEYVEKQIRNSQRHLSNTEEKDSSLRQLEDIFNEMNGDGLNRLVSKFFNEFRKLSDEPENAALRQSVREASQSMINDFHRIRKEVDEVRRHLDSRLEGYTSEINSLTTELVGLNEKIRNIEPAGGVPNDLLDKRDQALKKLASYLDYSTHYDRNGNLNIDIQGVGVLMSAGTSEKFSVDRTPANENGKANQSFDVKTSGNAGGVVTQQLKGGKIGAVIEVRDKTITTILSRLDEMAYTLTESVNAIHREGVTPDGVRGVDFFRPCSERDRAAEFIGLSMEVENSVNNIATAVAPDSPGDNRIALAISRIQNEKILNDGHATADEWFNSIVSDVGVVTGRNRAVMNQQKDIMNQLGKVREQISGVSVDEETANLLQFQHVFDASAKLIQVADDMLKTVLGLKRD